ncbi:MAG: haloacid dehalogenase-like hydrolase [Ginsengibacter sp.]
MKNYKPLYKKTFFLFSLVLLHTFASAQTFRPIKGWSAEVNQELESFLNSTLVIQQRKVAVFDCDGTLLGQVPYYLADEALYGFAETHYADKKDELSKHKMHVINQLLHGNNTGVQYVKERIDFLSGMTTEEAERIGEDCFHAKYQQKIYPQMRELLADLQAYGFEIWILSASPEVLYQQFIHEELGIPLERILGVKSVVRNDTISNSLVLPVPQNEGKAEALQTFIKARPLFVAGNSRGDMEMMNTSVGIKLIVNPADTKVEKGTEAGAMNGYTVKDYWQKKGAIIVHCNDVREGGYQYTSGDWGIKANESHPAE